MIIDDYLKYLDEYRNKYGENTIILIQVGSFFELYSIDANSRYLYNIADICNIQISRKNKSILEVSRNNPIMCGFPLYVLNKYIQLILQNNYTIVLIEQVTEPPEPQRKITEILSPATNININSKKSNYIMVLYYEEIQDILIVGITGVDLTTGRSFIYENASSKSDPQYTLDESYRLITTYNPCEILILSDKLTDNTKKKIMNVISSSNNALIHKKWDDYELNTHMKKIDYQNKILAKSFANKTMLSIIEYLNLEKYSLGRLSFCCLLQFAYEHNSDIIRELKIPELIENTKNLAIEYNSALQLNIISNNNNEKPLLDILNRCNTAFGSRIFKERFLNPINNKQELIKRYNTIENYLIENKYKNINKYLTHIIDLERIKRKIILKKMQPSEWGSFASSLENTIEVFKLTEPELIINVSNIMKKYEIINLDECSKYNINDIKTNIFNIGVYKDLDDLNVEYNKAYDKIVAICNKISSISSNNDTIAKIDYNDSEGYNIIITKKRFENALKIDKQYMEGYEKKLLTTTNSYKLSSKEITIASNIIRKTQYEINTIVISRYYDFLASFFSSEIDYLDIIIKNLIDIDITCCNAKNAFEYSYYKPTIDLTTDNSFINAENLRHPIIERIITDVEYVGNDIQLNQNGILLYGINASGKSSFMKAIGLSIIMAQSGMYVPAVQFKYNPYNHIMTRICGNDNIYKGMSSFVVEMTELRNIIQRADKNSLIIGDEICSGTEAISGVCIVSSAINELLNKKVSFIFTSHLHELSTISLIRDREELKIFHMHIEITNDNKIIYERKLKEGQGSNIYGIEVCKSLDMPINFMINAEKIRKELLGINDLLLETKKSNYNTMVYMDICQICQKNKSQDTHHINYQSFSNQNGYFENYHKNAKHNLVNICKECHDKEHNGEIYIEGFKQTNEGIILNIIYDTTEEEKLKIYIKRGKNGWYSRKAKNHKFKISTEIEIIDIINKYTKKKCKEISDYLETLLYDPSI
jgi:DNA mismatch repair protein MutS